MRRRLFNLAAALLAVTIAALVAWSLTPFARFTLTRDPHVWVFAAYDGRLFVTHLHFTARGSAVRDAKFQPKRHSIHVELENGSLTGPYALPAPPLASWSLGFASIRRAMASWSMHQYVVPLWPLVVVAAVPVGVSIYRGFRRARRAAAGRCTSCGYDLRATPDRCPECGAVPTGANPTAA